MKKNKFLLTTLIPLMLLSSCQKSQSNVFTCIKDDQFGGIYFNCSIEDFNNRGFTLGDSVSFTFYDKDGKVTSTKEDVPYYNGYYGQTNDLIVCAYKGYISPMIARCQGSSTYEEFKIDENTKVEFKLYEKAKYLSTQEALNLVYYDDIAKYDNDKVRFANFYTLEGEHIKPNMFYRSASPCDDDHKRATYASALLSENSIPYSINLSESKEEYDQLLKKESFLKDSYYHSLVTGNNVDFLNLDAAYRSEASCKSIAGAIKKITNSKPAKVHFHCMEGKDRTGFLAALILALAGESSDVIIQDYMKTYYNYYGVTSNEQRYFIIAYLKPYDFILYLKGLDTGEKKKLNIGAKKYLINGGMTEEEVNQFVAYITSN